MSAHLFILSGGPCSGKSTLLEALRQAGFAVITESAEETIRSSPSLLDDPLRFQETLLKRQLRKEAEARRVVRAESEIVFSDRGIGDHFGYLAHAGIGHFPELLEAWSAARDTYQIIFLLEQNPNYETTTIRRETPEEARNVHAHIVSEYQKRHPRTVVVPWLPMEERLRRVVDVARAEMRPAAPTPSAFPR